MLRSLLVLVFIFCFKAALCEVPEQIKGFNFDCDDNIFYLPTEIMLKDKRTGSEKGVSTQDYAEIRSKIGVEGEWKNFEITKDSFRYFGDGTQEGASIFPNHVKKAIHSGNDKWKGPALDAFIHALSKPETAQWTTIITAREHAPDSVLLGLKVFADYILKTRRIKLYLPPAENIFPVGWKGLPDKYKKGLNGISANPSAVKANVMMDLLDRIEKTPIPENGFETLNQAGTKKEKLHLWGFSDDDLGNYKKAVDVLSGEVKKGRYPHVKIVLFFTGTNVPGTPPHSVVIQPDGTLRPTKEGEAVYTKPNSASREEVLQIKDLLRRCAVH